MWRIEEVYIFTVSLDLDKGEVKIRSQLLGNTLGHEDLPTPDDPTDASDDADSFQVTGALNLVDLQPAGLDHVY
ncbi:hypothetical protein ACFW9O_19905 [Streptomyces sp. NPDC059499]|uniref:hypothetical protein n=1 Tax=Streptomyces sp. NPDC059499 TaxID=3346852 RepID=UPI00367BEA0D